MEATPQVSESRHDQHEREVREAHLMQAVGLLFVLIAVAVLLAAASALAGGDW